MSIEFKIKVCGVIDFGSHIQVAQRLAREDGFGKVYYYRPYQNNDYPEYNESIVGEGVDGIIKIDSIHDVYDEVDLWIFTGLFNASLQEHMRSEGKKVFGIGRAEKLETSRRYLKETLIELGLRVGEYENVDGFNELRQYLEDKEDLWIKTDSRIRGNMDTWHYEDKEMSRYILDDYQHELGAYKKLAKFIVEKPINNCVEYGSDLFVIDGRYPKVGTVGIEIKDSSYLCCVKETEMMPKGIIEVNNAFASIFTLHESKGCFSTELKNTKEGDFLLDITLRQPEPNTGIQLEIYENYPEIVWCIASGIVPNIRYKYKYGAEIIIKSEWAKEEPQPIYFPEEYKNFVKIKNLTIQNGIHCYVPQNVEMTEIGACIGLGNTPKEAIDMAKKIAKEIKGYGIKINSESLDEAQKEIDKLAKAGIKFF